VTRFNFPGYFRIMLAQMNGMQRNVYYTGPARAEERLDCESIRAFMSRRAFITVEIRTRRAFGRGISFPSRSPYLAPLLWRV
jgi:hypothetical protein